MDDSRWIPRKIDFHCRVLFLFLLVYKEIAIIANTQGISISIKLFQFFFCINTLCWALAAFVVSDRIWPKKIACPFTLKYLNS